MYLKYLAYHQVVKKLLCVKKRIIMDIIIKKLEEQISFLQNEVNQMSDEIFTQQKEILGLKKEILLLKEKIDSIETNVENENSLKDSVPPHY